MTNHKATDTLTINVLYLAFIFLLYLIFLRVLFAYINQKFITVHLFNLQVH